MTIRSSVGRSVALVVSAVLFVACGTNPPPATPIPSITPSPSVAPSPSQSLDPEAQLDAIEEQVSTIRELQPKGAVDRSIIDEPELVDLITARFNEDNPEGYVDAYGRLLKHLALMPADDDLGDLYLELLGSQVIGLYAPDTKQLYVVVRSGVVGPLAKITFAHEFDHALQDQHFDLNEFAPLALDQGDRSIARAAVMEGDGTLLMSLWASQHLTPEELGVVVAESTRPESEAILARMPAILREGLEFPYQAGLSFVGSAWQTGGWQGVDALYADPPATTEQVIHAEKYVAQEAAIPVTIEDGIAGRLGNGWTERLQDTLGEFQMRIWIREAGKIQDADALAAAAGWGGDRVALYEGPDGAWAVVVETAWDSQTEASEFVTEAAKVVTTLDGLGSADVLQRDPTQATVVVGSDDAVLGRLANALGLAG